MTILHKKENDLKENNNVTVWGKKKVIRINTIHSNVICKNIKIFIHDVYEQTTAKLNMGTAKGIIGV